MNLNLTDPEGLRAAAQQCQALLAALNAAIDPHNNDVLPAPREDLPNLASMPPDLAAPTVQPPAPTVQPPAPVVQPSAPIVQPPEACAEAEHIDVNPRSAFSMLATRPAPQAAARTGPILSALPPPPNSKVGTIVKKNLTRMYLEDPIGQTALWHTSAAEIMQVETIVNPHVKQGRNLMREVYSHLLTLYRPELGPDEHWYTQTVLENACGALMWRIRHTRGRDGGPIQSRTAVGWLAHHVYNIVIYTRDPQTSELGGLSLLRRGLFLRLENTVKYCVIEYNLVRHTKVQTSLDRAAIQLIIEHVLTSSETRGRQVAFQTLTAITFAMHGAFRAGSMQANCKEYREQKMFMQVGHLTITRLGWCKWAVLVDVLNWKGYSGPIGQRKQLTFGPVAKAHNTITDVINYNKSPLPIRQECKEYPVWLKCGPGGLKVIEGVPCGPHKLTQRINYHGGEVGIKGAGVHAVRRGTTQDYVTLIGRDLTANILNHGDRAGVVMDDHYTTLRNQDLVPIRMHELTGNMSDIDKAALKNTQNNSLAINVMIRRLQCTSDLGNIMSGRPKITAEAEEKILKEWRSFVGLFSDVDEPYTRAFISAIDRVQQHPTTASSALIDTRVANLRVLSDKLSNIRRIAFRRLRNSQAKQNASNVPQATTEEREQAQKMAHGTSPVIIEANKALRQDIREYLNSKRYQEPVETAEEGEEEDAEAETVTDAQEPLQGRGLPPPSSVMSSENPRISQLNISLQRLPKIDLPSLENESELEEVLKEFDDQAEQDVLPMNASVMRCIYLLHTWQSYERQTIEFELKDGWFVCVECPKFPSRRDRPEDFRFKRRDKFNRHLRESHDAWSELELVVQTDDPDKFRCPGCDETQVYTAPFVPDDPTRSQ
ncbi:unnamed protein product [Rhizoctonia solani]|uniref:Uncharacterized protein n=1 Tax=Rhizoctonia solani TaxID=456999 RepID=A0A8H3CCQ0_9AGAM|nr:unnamed protein product [Rhizoctonia solani]